MFLKMRRNKGCGFQSLELSAVEYHHGILAVTLSHSNKETNSPKMALEFNSFGS